MNYYISTTQDAINDLKRDKARALATAAAWDRVEIKKKKDGSEFAQLSRALTGATLRWNYGDGNDIQVDGYDPDGGVFSSSFCVGSGVSEMTRDEMRAEIARSAELYREHADKLQREIDRAQEYFNKLENALSAVREIINSEKCKGFENCYPSDLYFLALDIAKHRF